MSSTYRSLEERFDLSIHEWIRYCSSEGVQKSRSAHTVTLTPAFRTIVHLGRGVLPLIDRAYRSNVESFLDHPTPAQSRAYDVLLHFGFERVILALTKDLNIPDEVRMDIDARTDYVRGWLRSYLER